MKLYPSARAADSIPTPRRGGIATRLPSDFITIRSQPGHEYHATLRVAAKPWPVVARCSNTSGPLHAAEAVMRKAGHRGVRAELVPLEQWAEASNGYAPTSRARITHLYRIVA